VVSPFLDSGGSGFGELAEVPMFHSLWFVFHLCFIFTLQRYSFSFNIPNFFG
jgi:hypothetical protein